jgi:hypothetical protein
METMQYMTRNHTDDVLSSAGSDIKPIYIMLLDISDTLEITILALENKYHSIDTTSSHQTIVKSNGKWRNINSL